MKKSLTAVNLFAIVLGLFFIVEGGWGMVSPVVFGVFTTNFLHAIIHLLLGVTGIYLGSRNQARKFILFTGVLLTVVGVLYFVPGADELVVKLLNVNNAVAYFNIIVGILAILLALLTPKRVVNTGHEKHQGKRK